MQLNGLERMSIRRRLGPLDSCLMFAVVFHSICFAKMHNFWIVTVAEFPSLMFSMRKQTRNLI